MGFSGGGSNITKAHTHDSTIVQDGGSLAANVTQFGLTAGSILYSDGSNIQELAVGAATEQLAVNTGATAPEWVTAGGGGGGGNLELIETKTATGTSTTAFDFTFATPLDFSTTTAAMYFVVGGGTDGTGDVRVRAGDTAEGAVMTSNYNLSVAGSTSSSASGQDQWLVAASDALHFISAFGYITTTMDNDGVNFLYLSALYNQQAMTTILGGQNTTATDGTLKYFNFYQDGSYFESGTSCTCYKVKRA